VYSGSVVMNARVLVLVVAVGAGLVAAFLAMQMTGQPAPPAPAPAPVVQAPSIDTVDVLVASRELPIGTRIQAGDLIWDKWPRATTTERYLVRSVRPAADAELVGMIARQTMLAGDPVREERLTKADRGFMSVLLAPGMRAVAVEVKAVSTAGGFVLPNDRVDVLLTRAAPKGAGSGDPYVSETLLQNIKILAVDQNTSDQRGEPTMVAKDTATLELTPHQAETLAQAQQLGTISLALRSIRDAETPLAANEDDGGTVKFVRYGVVTRITTKR
jgi:pilus assembly protein CpaB